MDESFLLVGDAFKKLEYPLTTTYSMIKDRKKEGTVFDSSSDLFSWFTDRYSDNHYKEIEYVTVNSIVAGNENTYWSVRVGYKLLEYPIYSLHFISGKNLSEARLFLYSTVLNAMNTLKKKPALKSVFSSIASLKGYPDLGNLKIGKSFYY